MPMIFSRTLVALALLAPALVWADVFINEIHYDNTGTDVGEAIEVVATGGENLTLYSIKLYNASDSSNYDTDAVPTGSTVVCGASARIAVLNYPSNGIQNGNPDGIALIGPGGTLVPGQFLSYGGSFAVAAAPINGATSTNIGVAEASGSAAGLSLQLGGGPSITYAGFAWTGSADDTFGACNNGQSFGAAVDNPPTVASSVPADGATDIAIDTPFSITFSEPVDTIGTWFTFACGLSSVPTLTASNGPATTFTLTPSGPLGYSKLCTLRVLKDQVRDRDGNADFMAVDKPIQFQTVDDNLPIVLATTPIDQATNVGRSANLSVTFNEPVTAPAAAFAILCPNNAASSLPFLLSNEYSTVFTLNPNADLPASTVCRLFVDRLQVTDLDGTPDNPDLDTRINFTTAALAPPAVVSTVPAKNATNFPSTGNLQVGFDASVTLAPGAFTLTCAQSTGISLTHASNGSSFVIATGTALVAGDTCTFTIVANAVTSGDGLQPAGNEVVAFTVATLGPGNYYGGVDASSCAVLRTTLHARIDDHTVFPYTGAPTDVWTLIETGDQDPNDSGRVLDVYFNKSFAKGTDRDNGTNQPQGTRFNREHTWPQSLGFSSSNGDLGFPNAPRSDGHMIYASEKNWNADRGNKPYANCAPPTCSSRHTLIHSVTGGAGTDAACNYASGNCSWVGGPDGNTGSFETWTRRKGDVARAVLYMDIRYEGGVATGGNTQGQSEPDLIVTDNRNLIQITWSSPAYMGLRATLLAWHALDPPDAHEQLRNEAIFSFQGNRNPFIDRPEWAECLFNCNCTPPNAPPVAVADAPAAVVEDSGSNVLDVLTNDTDSDGGPKTVVSVTQPVGGVAAVGTGGANVTFTPSLNFCASTSFSYTLNGNSSATVSVTMTCANDPPTAVGTLPPRSAQEGLAITSLSVAGGFNDIDAGDDLDFIAANLPLGLSLDAESGQIAGTPVTGSAAGSVYTVTITATDVSGATAQQSFQYTVTAPAPGDPHIFGSGFEG